MAVKMVREPIFQRLLQVTLCPPKISHSAWVFLLLVRYFYRLDYFYMLDYFWRLDALPITQWTVSKHCRNV